MPPRGLPGNANLEQLKNGAKSFARAVRAGDVGAVDVVREFHPRLAATEPGSPELKAFTHADALLVVARSFDFESWPKLKSYLESAQELACSPHHAQPGPTPADEFLRLACLNYGDDEPERIEAARDMLLSSPELSRATIHAAAAAGDVEAARSMLAGDSALAGMRGGPFGWEPLLYLAYSRVGDAPPERSALETARLLLEHGADPNAGYLWEGLCPPFTVLTGALGGGENGPPAHEHGLALARLLLERGADPNDGQALYNQAPEPSEEWLELLLEFGLGQNEGSGPWYRRFGERLESPKQLLENLMMPPRDWGSPRASAGCSTSASTRTEPAPGIRFTNVALPCKRRRGAATPRLWRCSTPLGRPRPSTMSTCFSRPLGAAIATGWTR